MIVLTIALRNRLATPSAVEHHIAPRQRHRFRHRDRDRNGGALALTASGTLERFELGAKSTVARSLELLTKDEVLHRREQGSYEFEDPYYRRWIQLYAVPDLGVPVPPADPGTG